jgi:hypothetical protein
MRKNHFVKEGGEQTFKSIKMKVEKKEAFEILQDVEAMNSGQILKHYFGGYAMKERKKVHNLIITGNNAQTLESYNVACHSYLLKVEKKKQDDMPALLHSIILNSLAFEANEDLKETVYIDARDKAITTHGKPFIAAQYKIYRNAHESLFNINPEETNKRINEAERTIKMIYEYNLFSYENVEEILKLHFKKIKEL